MKPSIWRRMGRALGLVPKASYKAAKPSRSRENWTVLNPGPNAATASRMTLVGRSRDGRRNDSHHVRAATVWANNLVGSGLVAFAKHGEDEASKRLAAEADAVWALACKRGVLDVSGEWTYEALQAQQAEAMFVDGGVLLRRIWDTDSPIGMRVQMLEVDLIDDSLTRPRDEAGVKITQGVETNRYGRVLAYWLRMEHPGEGFGFVSKVERVPVSEIVYLRLPARPGQVHSVPATAAGMADKRDLSDFESYTLIAKKQEACVVGVVKRAPYNEWHRPPETDEENDDVIVPHVVNATTGEIEGTMKPGQWVGVEDGDEVVFNNPQLASNYDQFKKSHLQSWAVSVGLSYEQATGDFSNANYSTMRGGLLEFWALIDRMQWGVFVPAQDVVWGWVMEAGWLRGLISSPLVEAEWQVPARASIEPDKDVLADILEIRAGLAVEDDKIAARGENPDRLRKRIVEAKAKRDAMGIVVDTDPTKYAFRGAFPPAVQATPLADEIPPGSGE